MTLYPLNHHVQPPQIPHFDRNLAETGIKETTAYRVLACALGIITAMGVSIILGTLPGLVVGLCVTISLLGVDNVKDFLLDQFRNCREDNREGIGQILNSIAQLSKQMLKQIHPPQRIRENLQRRIAVIFQ